MAKKSEAENIEKLQVLEQNLQNILMQKQVFQLESSETENALSELKDTEGKVFKIVGNIMVNIEKEKIEKELKSKKEILELRLKNIEKQEESLKEKLLKTREEVLKHMQ